MQAAEPPSAHGQRRQPGGALAALAPSLAQRLVRRNLRIGQQTQRGLRQAQGHPKKSNLADHRKLSHILRRKRPDHEQGKQDLRAKGQGAGQGHAVAGAGEFEG